jgi:uncharacterized membrane protein YfcA
VSSADLLLALAAVVVGSLLKSITGMGLPLVAIPTISLFVGVQEAVVVMAVPNVLLNALLAWRERGALPATRDLPRLGGTAVVGAVAGTVLLVSIPAVVIGYAALVLTVPQLAMGSETSRRWAPAVGVSAGFLQGAIGISGPLVATWIHSYRLHRRAYVLSVSFLFLVAGVAQSALLIAGDRLTGLWLAALLASVPAALSVPLGTRLRDRLQSQTFDRLVLATLVASALALVTRTFA